MHGSDSSKLHVRYVHLLLYVSSVTTRWRGISDFQRRNQRRYCDQTGCVLVRLCGCKNFCYTVSFSGVDVDIWAVCLNKQEEITSNQIIHKSE